MKHRLRLWVVLIAVLAGSVQAADSGDAAYRHSFEQWKAGLIADLKQNWLPLAGLFWLKPGENTFGSDKSNAIVFPKGPAHAGSFDLHNGGVTVKFLPGVTAKIDGKPATTSRLQPDISGKVTVVNLGSLEWYVIQRGQRIGIRLRDNQSEAAKSFAVPPFYPINLNYRITATWVPASGKKIIDVPNVLGDTTRTPVTGEARFKINGQEVHLTDLGEEDGELFFVFSDLTSKTETYPGGRFLKSGPAKMAR